MLKEDASGSVSIVIPSYNGQDLLAKNLPRVIQAAENPKNGIKEIIVVDDGSTDGSIGFVRKTFPEVKLVSHKTNKGFSSAVNSGVGKSSGEFVVLLNNDVYPNDNFLENILQFIVKDPDVFAVSFHQKGYGWARGRLQDGFVVHLPGSEDVSPHPTFFVNAGGGIYRKDLWTKLGGMDEKLFSPFYWEDVDISYRAAKRGFKLFWHPDGIVSANLSATVNKIPKKLVSRIQERNQLLFIWKNLTSKNLFKKHLSGLARRVIKHPGYLLIALTAISWLPKILKLRRKEIKESKVSDEAIFSKFQNA